MVIQSFKITYFALQMKFSMKVVLTLTILLSVWLPYGCKEKSKSDATYELKAYRQAREAQDFQAAANMLLQIASKDSAGYPWVYDSLTLYHFLYLTQPNVVRNPATPKYYAEKGLKINPNNEFLLELKAKLLLEEQKDTASYVIIKGLWDKTGDYTYLWEMTVIELLRNRVNVVDSMVNGVIGTEVASSKTVRITDQIQQTVNAKAAFMYIKAMIYNAKQDFKNTAETLQACLKISPDFLLAQKGLYQLQQSLSGGAQNGQGNQGVR